VPLGHARELVREGESGLVMESRARSRSSAQVRSRSCSLPVFFLAFHNTVLLGVPQDRPRAVDQQHLKVRIAALADRAEPPPQAARRLPGREAEVAGEVTSGGKALHVAHEGYERRGGEQAHAPDQLEQRLRSPTCKRWPPSPATWEKFRSLIPSLALIFATLDIAESDLPLFEDDAEGI
jgi:hypothetical protein